MEEEKIIRFLNNESSQEEKEEVSRWLDQPGAEQELEEILNKRWETTIVEGPSKEEEYQHLLQSIHSATRGKSSTKRIRRYSGTIWEIGKIAASYLLWMFSAYLLYQGWQPVDEGIQAVEPHLEWIVRETDTGEKRTIILPDQSKVVMNSLSKLTFGSDYGKAERLILLEGEAYFEVSPDPDMPFMVKSGTVVTRALGTAFNASLRDGRVAIHLTEGRVSVKNELQEVTLNPGEMAAVSDSIDVGVFDEFQVTAWKEGKITFQKKNISEILFLLEEWYGVTFTENKAFDKNRTVTGTFNNENLADILNGLSFSVGFVYQIDGKNVQIQ